MIYRISFNQLGYYDSLKGGVSANYCQIPIKYLTPRPEGISENVAASLGCTYLTAYQALIEKAKVKQGQSVMIYGASGGVGTAAIHIAKKRGTVVMAVSHSRNEKYCLEQGADFFIAYDKQGVFEIKDRFDLFFQVFSENGSLYSRGKKLVHNHGMYIKLIPNPLTAILGRFKKPKSDSVLVKSNQAQLVQIIDWAKTGYIHPNIDKVYTLDEYSQAFSDLKKGNIKGKAVISFH